MKGLDCQLAASVWGHSAIYRSIHAKSVLGPIADYFVANWQRRFKPTRHHAAGAGSHAPSSIRRAINGFRTPSERDQIRVPNQDAAPLGNILADVSRRMTQFSVGLDNERIRLSSDWKAHVFRKTIRSVGGHVP